LVLDLSQSSQSLSELEGELAINLLQHLCALIVDSMEDLIFHLAIEETKFRLVLLGETFLQRIKLTFEDLIDQTENLIIALMGFGLVLNMLHQQVLWVLKGARD
jgi:hypothetical protein